MTEIIEKEQLHDKDFGACFTVKAEFNMNLFELQMANWMNKHSHVAIDANGQDRTDCFLHLTEFCWFGSTETMIHDHNVVEEMMSRWKTNANE